VLPRRIGIGAIAHGSATHGSFWRHDAHIDGILEALGSASGTPFLTRNIGTLITAMGDADAPRIFVFLPNAQYFGEAVAYILEVGSGEAVAYVINAGFGEAVNYNLALKGESE
jgi:hypothetical protein